MICYNFAVLGNESKVMNITVVIQVQEVHFIKDSIDHQSHMENSMRKSFEDDFQ